MESVLNDKLKMNHCQFHWPPGLRRGSTASHLLGLRVRIPPGAWVSVVSVVCCQVQVCAPGRSLVHWSPTECSCVIEVIEEPHRGSLGPLGLLRELEGRAK